jgi:predicted metal-dependent phosphoesterase TrpH
VTLRADLHTHSTRSDGLLSPTALVRMLADAGIDLFALTDHDTVAGLAEAGAAARDAGLIAVPGIELSASWQGRGIHVVGLGIDPTSAPLTTAIAALETARHERAELIAARLDRAGAPGHAALEHIGRDIAPTRTHIARALVALGAAPDAGQVFKRWLGRGRPCHVPWEWPTLEATIRVIDAAGGVAVLAHPLRYTLSAGQRRQLARAFRESGGTGIEVVTGGAAPHQVEAAAGLCLRAGLEGSVGSDCHDPALPWHRPGRLAKLPEAVTPVWHRWGPPTRRVPEP